MKRIEQLLKQTRKSIACDYPPMELKDYYSAVNLRWDREGGHASFFAENLYFLIQNSVKPNKCKCSHEHVPLIYLAIEYIEQYYKTYIQLLYLQIQHMA